MSVSMVVMGLCGVGVGLGLLLVLAGWHGVGRRLPRWRKHLAHLGEPDACGVRWLLAAAAVGMVVGIATGWIVAGVLAGMAIWALPRVFGSNTTHARTVARVEAIASWSEMLRDTLAAAAGLEQTITTTAPIAPEAIRPQINELTLRLERGDRLIPSLRHVADQLADPTADLVISALILASERQARQLADLLGELAHQTRDQVCMRLRVEAGRARTRTSVRMIVGVTLAFAAGLVVLNRSYLVPFDSAFGQLMLALVGALFTIAFWWLDRIARIHTPARFLTDPAALHTPDDQPDDALRYQQEAMS